MVNKIALVILIILSLLMYVIESVDIAIYFAILALIIKIQDAVEELKKNRF